MPYKFTLNRVSIDMTQQRVIGYRRTPFWQEWWHYVEIDDGAARPRRGPDPMTSGIDRRRFTSAARADRLGECAGGRRQRLTRRSSKRAARPVRVGRDRVRSAQVSDLYSNRVNSHLFERCWATTRWRCRFVCCR
jgi:hypothetical protein